MRFLNGVCFKRNSFIKFSSFLFVVRCQRYIYFNVCKPLLMRRKVFKYRSIVNKDYTNLSVDIHYYYIGHQENIVRSRNSKYSVIIAFLR